MSVRLNVLLVQSARMSGLQERINAELAVQMMGVPGLDLSIVTSLKSAEATDTDRLLLSSFQSDLAILDWRDPSEMVAALGEMGIAGSHAPHRLDPSAPAASPGSRRLYLVDLRRGDRPAVIVQAMRALLNDRRVVAVTLTMPGISKASSSSSTANASTNAVSERDDAQRPVVKPADYHASEVAAASGAASPDRPPDPTAQPQKHGSGPAKRPGERELDALVDGVNEVPW